MKLRRTMKAQSSKKKEKERNNKEKKKRISVKGHAARITGKTRGHAARISIRPEDMQQEESTSRPYVCSDFQQKDH